MMKKKLADKKIYAWYTILYIAISMVVFGQLLIFDKTLIWDVDGYLQWYPLFVKFQNSFHDWCRKVESLKYEKNVPIV